MRWERCNPTLVSKSILPEGTRLNASLFKQKTNGAGDKCERYYMLEKQLGEKMTQCCGAVGYRTFGCPEEDGGSEADG